MIYQATHARTRPVKSLRENLDRTLKAIVLTSIETADTVTKAGKIQIGCVLCRAREKPIVKRCFRCLGFGHTSSLCTGEETSQKCRLCGIEGHKVANCKNSYHCVICSDNKAEGGANHILESSKCQSYKAEVMKMRR